MSDEPTKEQWAEQALLDREALLRTDLMILLNVYGPEKVTKSLDSLLKEESKPWTTNTTKT